MSEDPNVHSSYHRSWLERLSQALIREPQDRDQLVDILRDAEQRHLLDAEALTMIEGVLQVSVMRTRDIMVPRGQMVVIDETASLEEILPIVIESAHSRFPVIAENRDKITGILFAKDLLAYCFNESKVYEAKGKFKITALMRSALFVPESKRLDVLLREFRRTHHHMALVIDEYGGVAGLITIEDVLEQIVGEIEDEHDIEEELNIKKHSESEYIIKALTPVEDFNEYFSDNLSDDEYDTIGGLVLSQFGHLPKKGEIASVGRYDFTILKADKRRIHLLKLEVQ